MWERTAARLIVCLFTVALLVGSAPAVGLPAALEEGDTARRIWCTRGACFPRQVGLCQGVVRVLSLFAARRAPLG